MNHSVTPDPRFKAWFTERAPRVAPPDLLERAMGKVADVPQESRWALRWPLSRFAASVTATLILTVAVGAGLLLSWVPNVVIAPPSTSPSATARATATSSVAPTPVPSVIPSPAPAEVFRQWTRFEMPDPAPDIFGGGTPSGVVRFGDRYVAVGAVVSRQSASSESRVVVWMSVDGKSWDMHDDIGGFPYATPAKVLTDGDHLLVLGRSADPLDCCIGVQPAAWVSNDGINWTRAEGPAPSVVAVAAEGFIGAVVDDEEFRFVTSADGRSWTDASEAFRGAIDGLAVDARGRAVAVGHVVVPSEIDGSATTDLAVWRSADGSSWSGPDILARGAMPRAVVAAPIGFVVAGQEYGFRRDGSVQDIPRIWRLTEAGLDPVPVAFEDGQTIDRIVVLDETLVAIGSQIVDGVANLVVWVSTDGGDGWARVPEQGAFAGVNNTVTGIAESADGLVAVGHRWDSESGHLVPVAWLAPR